MANRIKPPPPRSRQPAYRSGVSGPDDIKAAVKALLGSQKFQTGAGSQSDTRPLDGLSPEQQIRRYVRDGPGFLGDVLDAKVDLGMLAPITPREWDKKTGGWVATTHPGAWAAFRAIRGPQGQDVAGLAAMAIREIEEISKVGMALKDNDVGPGLVTWVVSLGEGDFFEAPPLQGDPASAAFVWPMREGMKWSDRSWREQPNDWVAFPKEGPGRVREVFQGSARFPGQPNLRLRAVLPDIRRFVNASRALHRATASQLLLANLLWFKGSTRDVHELAAGLMGGEEVDSTEFGMLAQQLLMLIEAGDRSMADMHDRDTVSVMPYLMVGDEEPPKPVELGRIIDKAILDVKEDALKDIGRGLAIPLSHLIDGPGAGQRLLNEWKLDAATRQRAVPSTILTAEGLTNVAFRPIFDSLSDAVRGSREATEFCLLPDISRLTDAEPASLRDLLDSHKAVGFEREAIAKAAGMDGKLLPLPEGVSEYDLWESYSGLRPKKTAAVLTPFD